MRVLATPFSTTLLRMLFALLLVTVPAGSVAGSVVAQESSELATPTNDEITEPAQDELEPDAETSTDPELDQTTEEREVIQDDSANDDAPVPEDVSAEVEPTAEPVAEVPVPPVPELSYEPDGPASCLPVSGDPAEPVAAGGDLEYACTFAVSFQGANVDPASIALDWSVSASASGDWDVQLLGPTMIHRAGPNPG